jgi:hypothetical protein
MGVLVGNHGKLGSGKNEGAKQIKGLFVDGNKIEEKAFADNIKFINSVLCRSTLRDQYTEEGKNTKISLFGHHDSITIATMVSVLKTFKTFEGIREDLLLNSIVQFFVDIYNARVTKGIENPNIITFGELQQQIGTGFREKYGEDIWVDLLFETWTPECNWIITDLRFPNEKRAIRKRQGKCLKFIGDPRGVRARSKRDLNHISETALDGDNEWDWVVDNRRDDLNNLRTQLVDFVDANRETFCTFERS